MFEGWGGVVFGGENQIHEGAVFAGGGFEFDVEADGAGFLFECGLAFGIQAEFADVLVLGALIYDGAGAGLGFKTGGVEVQDGAGFGCDEEFVELCTVVAFAGYLGREAAQERAGALQNVGGDGDGAGPGLHMFFNRSVDQGVVCGSVADCEGGGGGVEM